MLVLDEYKMQLSALNETLALAHKQMNADALKDELKTLEAQMGETDFWNDVENANKVTTRVKGIKSKLERLAKLDGQSEDIETLIEMAEEEDDESLVEELKTELKAFDGKMTALRLEMLLKGPYDNSNAILSLHAGAGGTEAQDWTEMLYRMYTRYCEKRGWQVRELDLLDGDEAGIKSVTIQVNGTNAYGLLKSEHGVHRLVRISPFNAQGKRQTSFVSCDVMPDIEEDLDVQINPDDIRIDTYRSSGAGGQHINKTSSAIRITHFPTGIVVTCQNERSQFQNKDKAMQMLKAKLFMLKQEENELKLGGIRGEVKKTDFGSQIRSYFLQPYTMVSDLRSGEKSSNASGVLDGDLDPFINAYLKWLAGGGKPVGGDDEEV